MPGSIPAEGYALIIGAMKCGTSSLYDYLRGHPQICPAAQKEPEFFASHQMHGRQVAQYSDLWCFDPVAHKYALEASTGYTKYPEEPDVARKIYEYGIRPRFIYLVRDPFDRIVSHYVYMRKKAYWDLAITAQHLVDTSNYFVQLEQYRKYFERDRILVLDFDALKDDPAAVLRQTYDFLGLPHTYFPRRYGVINPTVARPMSTWEKQLRRSKLGPLLRYIPTPLRRIGKGLLPAPPPAPPATRRTLTTEERATIHAALAADMARLRADYGVDVGKWGFEA